MKFFKGLLAFLLTLFAIGMAAAAVATGDIFTYVFAAALLAASARVWWLIAHPELDSTKPPTEVGGL